jgi:hypothetical protein
LSFYKEAIKAAVKNIDKIIEQKAAISDLKNQTTNFMLTKLIDSKQKLALDKKLNDIISIMDYYSERNLAIDDLNS